MLGFEKFAISMSTLVCLASCGPQVQFSHLSDAAKTEDAQPTQDRKATLSLKQFQQMLLDAGVKAVEYKWEHINQQGMNNLLVAFEDHGSEITDALKRSTAKMPLTVRVKNSLSPWFESKEGVLDLNGYSQRVDYRSIIRAIGALNWAFDRNVLFVSPTLWDDEFFAPDNRHFDEALLLLPAIENYLERGNGYREFSFTTHSNRIVYIDRQSRSVTLASFRGENLDALKHLVCEFDDSGFTKERVNW